MALKNSEGKGRDGIIGPIPRCKKKTRKCLRVNAERIKIVAGLDVGMVKVKGLMERALVGRLSEKAAEEQALCNWLTEFWRSVLDYTPSFHILVRGCICFKARSLEDANLLLKRD